MKLVTLALLTSLTLPLCAEAKTKAKRKRARAPIAAAPQAASGKLIDLTGPDADTPEGLISTNLSGRDLEFFQTALQLGGVETWLGEQAKQRGEADRVKAVGDALQATQAEENDRLQRLAKQKGVALPDGTQKAAHKQEMLQQLAKLSGPGFDKAVLDQISVVTQQSLDAYASAAESTDPDVKRLATQILPLVREKLVLANRLAGKAAPPGAKPGFRENAPTPPQ